MIYWEVWHDGMAIIYDQDELSEIVEMYPLRIDEDSGITFPHLGVAIHLVLETQRGHRDRQTHYAIPEDFYNRVMLHKPIDWRELEGMSDDEFDELMETEEYRIRGMRNLVHDQCVVLEGNYCYMP